MIGKAYVNQLFKFINTSIFSNFKLVIGTFIFLIIAILAIFGPIFSSYTYDEINLEFINSAPSLKHLFGTDELGRDIFTRLCFGARISFFVGFFTLVIDLLIGVTYGTVAGFLGNKVDEIMMRICDSLNSIPYLLYVIMFTVIFGPGFTTILMALMTTCWISMARIVRAEVLKIKTKEFILAAVAIGASKKRIIFNHLIPNTSTTVITTIMLSISQAIFTEAFLSFLGVGIQAPMPSWGVMIYDSISALSSYPWRLFFPASAISLMILSCNLVGENLKR